MVSLEVFESVCQLLPSTSVKLLALLGERLLPDIFLTFSLLLPLWVLLVVSLIEFLILAAKLVDSFLAKQLLRLRQAIFLKDC